MLWGFLVAERLPCCQPIKNQTRGEMKCLTKNWSTALLGGGCKDDIIKCWSQNIHSWWTHLVENQYNKNNFEFQKKQSQKVLWVLFSNQLLSPLGLSRKNIGYTVQNPTKVGDQINTYIDMISIDGLRINMELYCTATHSKGMEIGWEKLKLVGCPTR